MTARKNEVVVVFVLTGFGDADTGSEIRGLELRPELMPRAFPFEATAGDAPVGKGTQPCLMGRPLVLLYHPIKTRHGLPRGGAGSCLPLE
jgi:hypothetical protein